MPDRERKKVPDHRPDILKKDHASKVLQPILAISEYPRLSGEESEKESRDEATQRVKCIN